MCACAIEGPVLNEDERLISFFRCYPFQDLNANGRVKVDF